tara:strand:- start:3023 stop:3565 length:543 start_codon:yes stop_codon:yes gene_type:complete
MLVESLMMSKPAKVKPENVVNAYLFYSQRLLNLLNSTSLTQDKADNMAMTAAVCLSLKQTWQAWIEELSVYVGHHITDYASVFLPENSAYPEVAYLIELSKQQNNWLSQLMAFLEPRLNTATSPPLVNEAYELAEDVLPARINLVQVDSDVALSDEERLASVFKNFKAYISAVRTRQAEW